MKKIWILGMVATSVFFASCANKANTTESSNEDTSASGVAAGAVGGALSGASSNGTQALLFTSDARSSWWSRLDKTLNWIPSAWAKTSCPTYKTTGSGCTESGSTMWLTYDNCSFGSASAVWNGTQAITISSGTATCGTFPFPTGGGTLDRQMVAGSSGSDATTPSTATVTSSYGTTATIDDASPNLANFDGDSILPPLANGLYGSQVSFNSGGAKTSVLIEQRIYVSGSFDHSIAPAVVSGSPIPLTVTETSGASSRTITGTLLVYHNLLRVVGTSTFNNVVHTDECCFPTSGSITTAFTKGTSVSPTTAGNSYVGKSETLTFTGCGTVTYVSPTGASRAMVLTRCF